VPVIGVIFSIWLITFLAPETWLRFAVWFVIGLVIYFTYSKRHSVMEKQPTR
jgi:APA family basic amino acid/polyamine antiporter